MVTLAGLGRLRTLVPIWLLLVAILVTASVATAIFEIPIFLSPKPDFSLQPVGASWPVWASLCGSCREFRVKVNSLNGFTGIVSFTTSAPASLNIKLDGTTTNPYLRTQALLGTNDTLFVDVGASSVGNYTFTVTGTSGALSHSVALKVIAQSLTFAISPDPIPIHNVTSTKVTTNATITLGGVNGFSGNLTIGVVGEAEATARVYGYSVFLPLGGTTSATITAWVPSYSFGTLLPCRGPGSVTVSAITPDGGGVSHTFATVCVS